MAMRRDGPRPAVIGTCSCGLPPEGGTPAEMAAAQLTAHLSMIDEMARQAAREGWALDIAVLPEHSPQGIVENVAEGAEGLDGPRISALAAKARELGAYIAAPVHLARDGKVFNCLVMLDRTGAVLGVYDKAFPVTWTDGTLEQGVTPGCRFPVFDLDIGRVGLQICWDVAFPEGWKALAGKGAELVLYATDPVGLLGLRAHAWEHEYYIAAATHRAPCAVVEPTGYVLATTSGNREALVVRVDLDYRVLNTNCLWQFPESKRAEYAGRIRFDWREEEYLHLVTSLDPDLPVGRFLEQEGLLSGRERRARNLELIEGARGPLRV